MRNPWHGISNKSNRSDRCSIHDEGGEALRLGERRHFLPTRCGLPAFAVCAVLMLAMASLGLITILDQTEITGGRAGKVEGLDNGRISLGRVSKMMRNSVDVELASSEEAHRRLLDHEWSRFAARSRYTTSPFVVCSAPGRSNARRLRELAGGSSKVSTLSHRKGQPLCSVVSLDRSTATLIAGDGDGERFSLEPMTHFAKLAPAVAADPTDDVLAISGYTLNAAHGDEGLQPEIGPTNTGPGNHGRARNLQAGSDDLSLGDNGERRVPASSSRPTAKRLMENARRGRVDAIEIILSPKLRAKSETEVFARRWLAYAEDQARLARTLRQDHFWALEQKQVTNEEHNEDEEEPLTRTTAAGRDSTRRRRLRDYQGHGVATDGMSSTDAMVDSAPPSEEDLGEGEDDQEQASTTHEGIKRQGWAELLEGVEAGQGKRSWRLGRNFGKRSPGSCGFSSLHYSVSPNGKKVLLHRPHEVGDEGCLVALLAFVSVQPEVHYITARRQTALMNYDAAWVAQSGVNDYTPFWDNGLQGQDEVIGVADTGLDLNHCHFREDDGDSIEPSDWDSPETDLTKRKVVQYIAYVDDFDEEGGHGTHVSGTLAGAQSDTSAGEDEADGGAFQGKLAVFDFGDSDNNNALTTPDQIDEVMFAPAYEEAGARIHSNSWDTISTEYTSLSMEVDEYAYLNPDLLVVFAAGNCGDDTVDEELGDKCDDIGDDGGSVLSPAQAKNVVAVGSSENGGAVDKDIDTVSYFSSKGPTVDGRIKPDVVAPGDPVWSAWADPTGESCEFDTQTGTSMATPVVAGHAALVRQYFREGWYNTGSKNLTIGFLPSAALLKAVIVNSAVGMEFAGVNPSTDSISVTLESPPDEHQGHGRMTLSTALNVNSSVGLFFKDWIPIVEGETISYEVSLHEEADLDKDLRITLVWTDPPADISASEPLLHDLDLKVTAQSTGNTYYPNGYDEADKLNNVEKVIITDTTELETYTIEVTCETLTEVDNQYFAVVANGEFIETNEPPEDPDPSWLDILDSAGDLEISTELAVIIALGLLACCLLSCACRRCLREQRKQARLEKHRLIIAGRAEGVVNGRKVRQSGRERPLPYAGPIRQPSILRESFRRSAPSSSSRSLGSQRSARLTGAGAAAPVVDGVSDSTAPSTPPQEACPECGLLLSDVVQLVAHVEAQHGGRAVRRNSSPGRSSARISTRSAGSGESRMSVVTGMSTTKGRSRPSSSGRQEPAARAQVTETGVAVASSVDPRSSAPMHIELSEDGAGLRNEPSDGDDARRSRTGASPEAVGGTSHGRGMQGAAVSRMGASHGEASSSTRSSRDHTGSTRNSRTSTSTSTSHPSSPEVEQITRHVHPQVNNTGESQRQSRSFPQIVPVVPIAPVVSVSVSSTSREVTRASLRSSATATATVSPPLAQQPSTKFERPATRLKDLRPKPSSPGAHAGTVIALSMSQSASSASSPGGQRPTANVAATNMSTTSAAALSAPNRDHRDGSLGPSARENADSGTPAGAVSVRRPLSIRGDLDWGTGLGSGREDRGRSPAKTSTSSGGSLMPRAASLDRMLLLSARGLSTDPKFITGTPLGGDISPGGGGAPSDERILPPATNFRRMHSHDDLVPLAERLTVDTLREVGSVIALPTAVFSPVGTPTMLSMEPAYSPVDRARAEQREGWEERRGSKARQFFRQISR